MSDLVNERKGLTSHDLVELTGQKYRTLMRWYEDGLFDAIPETTNGKKRGHEFDMLNAQKALTIAELRDQGVSLQKVKKAIEALDEYGENLADTVLYTDGEGIYRVKDKNELDYTDLVDSPGQMTSSEFYALDEVSEKTRKLWNEKVA